jgi:hypothetical protein
LNSELGKGEKVKGERLKLFSLPFPQNPTSIETTSVVEAQGLAPLLYGLLLENSCNYLKAIAHKSN